MSLSERKQVILFNKRFMEIEGRLETLEINLKPDNLRTVIKFLKSKPDALDEIFYFKLNLKQIRQLKGEKLIWKKTN